MPKKRRGTKWGSSKAKKPGVSSSQIKVPSSSNSVHQIVNNESKRRKSNDTNNPFITTVLVRGTRSQNNIRYDETSRNHQCTAIAAVASAYSKVIPFRNWNTTIVDNVLDYGDQLYKKSILSRASQNAPLDLFAIEVFPNFIIDNVCYSLRILENDSAAGYISPQTPANEEISLSVGLPRIFQNYNSAIFTCELLSTCICKDRYAIYLFDSHSRGENGTGIEEGGKACLLKFGDNHHLLNYLIQNYNDTSYYNLVPVEVDIGSVNDMLNLNRYHALRVYEEVMTTSIVSPQNATFQEVNNLSMFDIVQHTDSEDSTTVVNEDVPQHYLGPMDASCHYCGAVSFRTEKISCCLHGAVRLPEISAYPELLKALLTDVHPLSKNFLKNIRRYNTLLALGSTSFVQREGIASGVPVIVVSGQIYHRVADVDTTNPSFGTLYFIDSGEATRKRQSKIIRDDCDPNLLSQLDGLLRITHPYARMYRNLGQIVRETQQNSGTDAIPQFGLYFHNNPITDRKTYAAPTTSDEISAIFRTVDGNIPPPGSIRVQLSSNDRPGKIQDIPKLSSIADALCYPLLFPNGELGWSIGLPRTRGRSYISKREFECYRLMSRSGKFNPLLSAGRLTQQFIVDKYVEVEGHRLQYLRRIQKKLRADSYVGLQDFVARRIRHDNGDNERVGRVVILPSSFTGGPRFMQQNYQDAMAIVAKFGRPSLFVTFTCNPNWREIKENINGNLLKAQDRPEHIARVFDLKRRAFFEDVLKFKIFGEIIAFVYVVEFQKRGLPHMHCLLTLADKDKLRDPDDVDKIISAELPPENTRLFNIIMSSMIHGPCGERNPNSVCMIDGQCSKRYPKQFANQTAIDRARPIYKRRNDGRTVTFKRNRISCTVDNRDVVPYSPYLSMKYDCHINVEVVGSVGCVKYVFKYINKGPDAAVLQLRDEFVFDEIKAYIDSRYVSSGESAWRLLQFAVQDKSHTIYRLPVHLPGERVVYFEEGQEEVALRRPKLSLLEAYFVLNQNDPTARGLRYTEIPLYYSFNQKENRWVRRTRKRKVIPRMYTISPRYTEKFHLRVLLLHVAGSTSFENLRTVNGITYPTFKDAVRERNLTASDREWVKTLEDAALVVMPACMRNLFAYMLCFCEIGNPLELWNAFKIYMYEDYLRKGYSERESENRALRRIDRILRFLGKNLNDFNLPNADQEINVDEDEDDERPRTDRTDFSPEKLNPEQRDIFDRIIAAMESPSVRIDKYFYVQGSGGTGKTFLYNAILEYCEQHRYPSIAVAFTGIAALLLKNGRTVHSTFKLPFQINDATRSSITAQSQEADQLRNLRLIIWDEISMVDYHLINIVDELLRDVCANPDPFGGKCILFGGDVKQLLPVASGRVEQTELFFTNCNSWNSFKIIQLNRNMRASEDGDGFSTWLENLGRGIDNVQITRDGERLCDDFICLPEHCLTDNVIREIYTDINCLNSEQLASRAILCPRNDHCNLLNNKILETFSGPFKIIYSIDSVASEDEDEIANYPEEYLNTVTPSGMPLHELKLKVGVPIILLKNLSLSEGLVNGTRLLVSAITDMLLTAEIITGRFVGRKVLIPRMDLISTDKTLPFVLKRRQFPVKVCFALTINKAQGQTFDRVGLYLANPVFSHGQLYVAFSRGRSWDSVKVQIIETRNQGHLIKSSKDIFTKNIVYGNILNSILNSSN